MNTKLTTEDLMIGDWVTVRRPNNRHEQVSIISDGTIEAKTSDGLVAIGELAIIPIPLTHEILEKNGFEEDDYYLQYRFYLNNKRLKSRCIAITPQDEDWDEIELDIMNDIAHIQLSLNYVHELQHALRLCGINDKEIVI